eukprot:m.252619 g.252619  ORF g.252619 m.252619 type:complete len:1013 (-) comp15473_c6_seq5:974-4012(-)
MSTSVLAIVSLVVAVAVLPSHALPQRLPSPTASFGSSAGLATTNDWPTLRTESLFDFVTALGEEPRLVRSSDIKAALKNQSTSVYQQLQAILRDLPNDPLNAYWTTATSLANPFKSALDIRSKGHRAVRQLKGKVPNPSTLLESGHTFVMRFEQLPLVQSDPVAKLTHFLEQITGLPVTIHAYVSGPTDVALNPHTDNYDVLVYHAQHKKHWTACVPPGDIGSSGLRCQAQEVAISKTNGCTAYTLASLAQLNCTSFDLHEGDVYQMPKGLIHVAQASSQGSAHYTIGLLRKGLQFQDILRRSPNFVPRSTSPLEQSDTEAVIPLAMMQRTFSHATEIDSNGNFSVLKYQLMLPIIPLNSDSLWKQPSLRLPPPAASEGIFVSMWFKACQQLTGDTEALPYITYVDTINLVRDAMIQLFTSRIDDSLVSMSYLSLLEVRSSVETFLLRLQHPNVFKASVRSALYDVARNLQITKPMQGPRTSLASTMGTVERQRRSDALPATCAIDQPCSAIKGMCSGNISTSEPFCDASCTQPTQSCQCTESCECDSGYSCDENCGNDASCACDELGMFSCACDADPGCDSSCENKESCECDDACSCDEAPSTREDGGDTCSSSCDDCTFGSCACCSGFTQRSTSLCCNPLPTHATWTTNITSFTSTDGNCGFDCESGFTRRSTGLADKLYANDTDVCCIKPDNATYDDSSTCAWTCDSGFTRGVNASTYFPEDGNFTCDACLTCPDGFLTTANCTSFSQTVCEPCESCSLVPTVKRSQALTYGLSGGIVGVFLVAVLVVMLVHFNGKGKGAQEEQTSMVDPSRDHDKVSKPSAQTKAEPGYELVAGAQETPEQTADYSLASQTVCPDEQQDYSLASGAISPHEPSGYELASSVTKEHEPPVYDAAGFGGTRPTTPLDTVVMDLDAVGSASNNTGKESIGATEGGYRPTLDFDAAEEVEMMQDSSVASANPAGYLTVVADGDANCGGSLGIPPLPEDTMFSNVPLQAFARRASELSNISDT